MGFRGEALASIGSVSQAGARHLDLNLKNVLVTRRTLARALGLLVLAFVIHRLDGRYETWAALREKMGWMNAR